jgi:hypothetical protein
MSEKKHPYCAWSQVKKHGATQRWTNNGQWLKIQRYQSLRC